MWTTSALSLLLAASSGLRSPERAPASEAHQDAPFERVLRLQVLLDRAHFSSGELDGEMGGNTRAAIDAYRRHRMPGTTASDDALADGLATIDSALVLVSYVLAPEDVAGPFVEIPADLMEQAKLESLGYSSALEGLGEKFHSSPKLLERLNPDKTFAGGEEIQVPNVQRLTMGKATKVVVSQSDQSVMALDAQGVLLARYPATLGGEQDALPIGDWKINGVQQDPPFHYNPELFWDAKGDQAKATLPPGPNNPVGVVWCGVDRALQGIHGHPRNPGPRCGWQAGVARVHPVDQLGRSRAGRFGRTRDARGAGGVDP